MRELLPRAEKVAALLKERREVERVLTLETGQTDRLANMRAFAAGALDLFAQSLVR